MWIKRMALMGVAAVAVVLAVGVVAVYARFSRSTAAWPSTPGTMSGEVTVSAENNEQYLPAVAYNWKRGEYLVVWHNTYVMGSRDIYGQRVSASGQLLGNEMVIASGSKHKAQPSVAYDPVNDRYLVAWMHDIAGDQSNWDVSGRLVPWDGPTPSLSEFSICDWGTSQWGPKVAYGRSQEEFFVIWNNEFSPYWYISGRRVKASDGTFPGGTGSDVTIDEGSENRLNADITYNLARNEYLVVYDNGVDVFATRLQGNGTPIGGINSEFGIAGWPDTEVYPAVAACNSLDQYLVTWQSLQSGTPNHNDVYARFVDGDGTFPTGGGPHVIYDTIIHEQNPDVACNSTTAGHMFLVTYEQQYSNISGPFGVWGRFVYRDYSMSSAFQIVAGTGSLDRTQPAVAGGRATFMTAWEHDRDTTFQDIHGRIVAPYGVFLPLVLRNA